MTTEKIKAHLTACGFEQQSKTRFHRKYIEVRVSEEDAGPVVKVSFYDPVADADLLLYVDLSKSEFIENALTDRNMDMVTFETAKRLKGAGFPQPEYIALGFGYTDDGTRFYIEECRFPMGGVSGMCFAPTATDIMRHLPDDLPLQFQNGHFRLAGWKHKSSAEAAAAEYLQLRENEK